MNKKTTTIDDLAVMIEKESSANEKRFGTLEDGFTELKNEFAEIKESMLTKRDLRQFEARILAAIGDFTIKAKDRNRRILALEKIVKP